MRRNRYLAAAARLAADVTALSEAATILESMPAPRRTRPWLDSAWMKRCAAVAGVSDAPLGLVDRFFGTGDRARAIAPLVRCGLYQLCPGHLQRVQCRLHVGLIGAGGAGAADSTDGDADEQVCGGRLGAKEGHGLYLQTMNGRASRPPVIVENAVVQRYCYLAATARLAADVTALSDAVTMLESMPTPHSTRPSLVSASMKLTACASEPAPVACWW